MRTTTAGDQAAPGVIRVLVAEDMDVVRSALVSLLEAEDDLQVVAEVADGDDLVAAAQRTRADVAVVDSELPVSDGARGAEVAERLTRRSPRVGVVVLTELGRPAPGAPAPGARGSSWLVLSNVAADTLLAGIRSVAGGRAAAVGAPAGGGR